MNEVDQLNPMLDTSKLSTVRANPGHRVPAHAPLVFLHARQTNLKAAIASPAKLLPCTATVALVFFSLFLFSRGIPFHSLIHSSGRNHSSAPYLNIVDWNQNIGQLFDTLGALISLDGIEVYTWSYSRPHT